MSILAIHAMVGLLILAITIILTIWNVIRITAKLKGPSLRGLLMGLIHLQVLFGIVAIIMYPKGGLFLLHPLTMIIAAILMPILTRKTRSPNAQMVGYIVTAVLLLIGVGFGNLS